MRRWRCGLSIFLWLIWCANGFAQNVQDVPVALQFLSTMDAGNNDIFRLTPSKLKRPFPEGTYQIKAQVALATEITTTVLNSYAIGWKSAYHSTFSQQGIMLNLMSDFPNLKAEPINLINFDELWFEFEKLAEPDACAVTLLLEDLKVFTGKNYTNKPILANGISYSDKVDALWLAESQKDNSLWLPRNSLYVIKRKLGLRFDNHWHYVQRGTETVIERRFSEPLHDMQEIDLYFASNTLIGNGYVRVTWPFSLKSDAVFAWETIPKRIERTKQGLRVRLYLSGAKDLQPLLVEKSSRTRNGFVSEIAIAIQGDSTKIVENKPLKQVIFQKSSKNFSALSYTFLPQHIESLSQKRERLVVDLRLLKNKWNQAYFSRGMLFIKPTKQNRICKSEPLSLRLVTLGQGHRPIILGDMTRFDRYLGGPFIENPEDNGLVEWIEKDASFSFSDVSSRELFHTGGVNLSQKKCHIQKVLKGVELTGSSEKIDLTWDHPIRLTHETRVLFMLSDESQIINSSIDLKFQDGERASLIFMPNRALFLGEKKWCGKILSGIEFHFTMKSTPFRVVLNEMILFHPRLIPKNQFLDSFRPDREWTLLTPTNVVTAGQAVNVQENKITGVTKNATASILSWNTPVDQPAHVLELLKLKYNLSNLLRNSCWLSITVNGQTHSSTKTLCSVTTEKDASILELFPGLIHGFDPDEKITSIDWYANLDFNGVRTASFNFQSSLISDQSPAITTILKKYPLFNFYQRALHPVGLSDDDLVHLGNSESVWINLGTLNMPSWYYLLQQSNLYPYFNLKKVVVGAVNSNSEWLSSLAENQETDWGFRLKLFVLSGLIILLIWFRRQTLQMSCCRMLQYSRCLLTNLRLSGKFFWNTTPKIKKLFNRIMGLVVFIGFWLSNYFDLSFSNHLFVFLLGLGVLWYEWRWIVAPQTSSKNINFYWFGRADCIAPVILTMTVLIGAWIAWNIGYGITWHIFLPLLAMSYWYLPWFPKIMRWFWSDFGITVFWSGVTLCLYYCGVYSAPESSENYFFMWGSICGVLIWRFGLRAICPHMQASWPELAKWVYTGAGKIYFSAAYINLSLVVFLLIMNRTFLAEQCAIVAYYLLVIGGVLEILALRRKTKFDSRTVKKIKQDE